MSELLDQTDIDALLSAVGSGDVETSGNETKIFTRHTHDLSQMQVRAYDFRRPERVSKDHMRALLTLHETFARKVGAMLSGYLRMIVEVRLASCEQMTYGEFVEGLPNPTSFNLIEGEGTNGQICLELSPLIIYPIIDRLLGGTNEKLFIPQRPLTSIEERLVSEVVNQFIAAFDDVWASVQKLNFHLAGMETNPQIVQIVAPSEVVVVVGFEIKLQNRAGTMSLCIPYMVIEPLMEALSAQSWFAMGRSRDSREYSERICSRIGRAMVDVQAILAETTMTLNDLMSLAPGDVLLTEKAANAPIVLSVEHEKKFLGRIGQHKGARAVRVDRAVGENDRV